MIRKLFQRDKSTKAPRRPSPGLIRFGLTLLPPEEGPQHFALIGSTGSGKTTLLRLLLQSIIPDIKPGSDHRALLYDANDHALPLLSAIAPEVRVVTMNPYDARGVSWKMSDISEPRVALEIAFTLIPEREESQPFFSDAARQLLYGVLLSYMERGLEFSFADLLRAFSSARRLRRILRACSYTKDLARHLLRSSRQVTDLLATVSVRLLPYGPIAAAWEAASESVSLEDWVNGEFILVLGNADISRNAINAINRCVFKRASDLTLAQNESRTRRSWFIVDELPEAGRLDGLLSLCRKGRARGVCVVISFQSIEGLRDTEAYGPHKAAEILGQIGHRFIGRLDCTATAEWASSLIGDQEIRQVTTNRTQGSEYSVTHNESFVTRRAVLPSELMSIPPTNYTNGLTGYYVLRTEPGVQSSVLYGPPLFDCDLIPIDPNVPAFIPRPADAQRLRPWGPEEIERFAPQPPKKLTRKQATRGDSGDVSKLLDDLGQIGFPAL